MAASLADSLAQKSNAELLVYLQDDDPKAGEYERPTGIRYSFICGPRITLSDMWNTLIPHATGDIFMQCADDVIFRTPGWNLVVESAFAAVPDKILLAFADDGSKNGKRFASLPFVHRRWVEAVGYFTGPGFSADFSDTWPNDLAEMVGRKNLLPILIEHMHHVWKKAPLDQTYRENRERLKRDDCKQQYENRLPERLRDADKLRAVMA